MHLTYKIISKTKKRLTFDKRMTITILCVFGAIFYEGCSQLVENKENSSEAVQTTREFQVRSIGNISIEEFINNIEGTVGATCPLYFRLEFDTDTSIIDSGTVQLYRLGWLTFEYLNGNYLTQPFSEVDTTGIFPEYALFLSFKIEHYDTESLHGHFYIVSPIGDPVDLTYDAFYVQ